MHLTPDEDSSDRILKIVQELSKPSAVDLIKRNLRVSHTVCYRNYSIDYLTSTVIIGDE